MKSFTCVIVDDEPRIGMLIQKLGKWDEYGYQVVSICYDGKSALQEICDKKPDLVLSDIKMPLLDGIELMDAVHACGLEPLFVIISGYGHFEYAQKAIQRGAIDYLLKPIDRDALNHILEKAAGLNGRQRQNQLEAAELEQAQNDRFWHDLIDDALAYTSEADFYARYRVKPLEQKGWLAVMQVSRPELMEDRTLFFDVVKRQAELALEGRVSIYTQQGSIYLLVCDADGEWVHARMHRLFYNVKYLKSTLGEFLLTIGVSTQIHRPDQLPHALEQAWRACNYRFEHGADSVIFRDDMPDTLRSPLRLLDTAVQTRITSASASFDAVTVCDTIRLLRSRIEREGGWDHDDVLALCERILVLVASSCRCNDQRLPMEHFWGELDHCVDYRGMFGCLERSVHELIRAGEADICREHSKPVREVKEYIQKNYALPLCLEDCARIACLSTAYLSTLFKKENGCGIIEYLNQVRCEHARELLQQNTLSVAVVAEQVGYADEKYFARQFKKVMGITPSEFRRVYS